MSGLRNRQARGHTPLRVALRRPWPGTRRGLMLWFFSLAFVALGAVNYVLTELPPVTRAALEFPLALAGPPFWGWLMVACGTGAAWSSYCHHGRDRWGFLLLATFCAAWGMGYVAGWLVFDAPLRAVSGSVVWLLFAAVLTTASGMPTIPDDDEGARGERRPAPAAVRAHRRPARPAGRPVGAEADAAGGRPDRAPGGAEGEHGRHRPVAGRAAAGRRAADRGGQRGAGPGRPRRGPGPGGREARRRRGGARGGRGGPGRGTGVARRPPGGRAGGRRGRPGRDGR